MALCAAVGSHSPKKTVSPAVVTVMAAIPLPLWTQSGLAVSTSKANTASAVMILEVSALLGLACLLSCGCGPGGGDGTPDTPGTTSMTERDYVAHIAALTIAVEEGLTGEDAVARAVELGSGGHSREEVEELAARLRSRPLRWVELEREIDVRIRELKNEADGAGGR